MNALNFKQLNFQKLGGIIPAIVQDAETKSILMLGFMNEEALLRTIKSKKVTFWSRTKQKMWEKGETSGNTLKVVSMSTDCDNDTLLLTVLPQGLTCHTGKYSCFSIEQNDGLEFLQKLYDVIAIRKKELPKNSYTTTLFKQGLKKILEKVEEESGEVVNAAKKESQGRLIEESADLFYHLFVLMVEKGVSLQQIVSELQKRSRKSE